MSEVIEDIKLGAIIGLTIAVVFRSIDFFSKYFADLIVSMWETAPEHAYELLSFVIVIVVFVIILLIMAVKGRR